MSLLYITPVPMIGPDGYQRTAQDNAAVLEPGTTTIILDFSSAAAISSELPHVADPTLARLYRIYADAACHIKAHALGDNLNVKAATTDMPWPADHLNYLEPGPTLAYISVIAAA